MKFLLFSSVFHKILYNLPVHKRLAAKEIHFQILSGAGISDQEIQRFFSYLKRHQRTSSVILSFFCKTISTCQITVMSNMKAKSLYNGLAVFGKFINNILINIFCKKHSLFLKLLTFSYRCFHILFLKTVAKLLSYGIRFHAFFKIWQYLIGYFIYKVDTATVDIQHNIISITLITVNQTHLPAILSKILL